MREVTVLALSEICVSYGFHSNAPVSVILPTVNHLGVIQLGLD